MPLLSNQRRALIVVALASLFLVGCATAQSRGTDLKHVSPAQVGWSEAGLRDAQDWSREIHATAVIVLHHDAVVAEWGDTVKRTELASVRKSLLSALIGIGAGEKKISLDSTLAQLAIDDTSPSLTDVEKQATVRMLLEARSGVYHSALYETADMAAERPKRGSHDPGTFWYYNNWDFNALGTIYEQAVGTSLYDAFDRQIARPIGMQDYRPQDGTYVTGAASVHRAYPIRMSARDLARFALLYLHDGAWEGRQIVPAEWVRDSTRSYSIASHGLGYGFLWWTAGAASAHGVLPEGSFFAWGSGGQFAFVIPAYDMVIVSRVDRDQKLPAPHIRDVARLLHLIFKAGGFEPVSGTTLGGVQNAAPDTF
jgi:CubicO group peptidase (beta-lactamase class C family)